MLARADLIAVEDSRVTAKLLAHIGVKRPMTSLSRSQCRPGPARPDRADARARRSPWSPTPARRSSPIPATSWSATPARPGSAVTTIPGPSAVDRRADPRRPADRPLRLLRLPARQGRRRAAAIAEAAAFRGTPRLLRKRPPARRDARRPARRPRRPRRRRRARDQQALRGDRHRHPRRRSPPAMPRRRPRARS